MTIENDSLISDVSHGALTRHLVRCAAGPGWLVASRFIPITHC